MLDLTGARLSKVKGVWIDEDGHALKLSEAADVDAIITESIDHEAADRVFDRANPAWMES